MRRVDQEYIIGIAIIVILVCVSICVYSTDNNNLQVCISPLMMVLVRNAVRAVQVFSENVRTKARQLRREKRRAETLVYQMLPRSHVTYQDHLKSTLRTVADNLRGSKNTSEMFDSATVCFTEIDGCLTVGHYDDIADNC